MTNGQERAAFADILCCFILQVFFLNEHQHTTMIKNTFKLGDAANAGANAFAPLSFKRQSPTLKVSNLGKW